MRYLGALLGVVGIAVGAPLPPMAGAAAAPPAAEGPRILVAMPLGVLPGVPTEVTLRGLKLDTATEVHIPELRLEARIVRKGKVGVPNQQEPARVGDTEAVVQITLPVEMGPGPVALVARSPQGASPLHRLFVDLPSSGVVRRGPNGGFQQAQPLGLGQHVDAVLGQPQEVHVYRIEGQAGQRLVVDLFAVRQGSALDAVLTLHDAAGRTMASSDDQGEVADPRLEVTLPRNGTYFLSILDAHDSGGPAHVYRLAVARASSR